MDADTWALINVLRSRRVGLGLTQTQVAAVIGVTRSSVTNFENGRQDLPVSRLVGYAAAVDVRLVPVPTELLGD